MAGDGAPTPTRLGALSPPPSTRLSNNSVGPRYFTYDDGAATTTRNHSSKKPALGVAGGGNMSPSALSPRRSAAMGTTSPSSPGSTRSAVSMGNGSGTHRENGISPSMMKQRVASASGGGSPAGRPSGDSNSRPPASPRSPVVSPSRRKASAIGASLARTAAGGEEGRAAMMAERRSPGEGSRAGGESRRSDSRAEESRLTSGNDSGRTGGGIGSTRNGEKVAGVGSPRERLVSRELKERRERRDADARRRMSREVVEDVNDAKEVAREVDRVKSVNETRGEVPRLTRVVRQTNTTAKEGEATEIGMDSGKSRELISSRRISTPRTAPDDKPRRDIAAASPLREKPEAIAPSVRDDSSAEVIQGKSNSKIGMKVQGEATPAHETNDKRRQDGGSGNSDRDGNDDGDSEVVSESEKNDAHTPLPDTTLSPRSKGESPRISMQKRMFANLRPPDSSLENLLTVLTDENTSHLRRVNACGAIKTLTLNKKNVIQLARTRGVISSITSVLCRVDASEEERTRCINALMHLCVPEENWRLVYLFPQTAEALARNMADRYPQIRYAACLALSFLAKKNRKEVVKNTILMHSIARVLEVDKNGALERTNPQDRKVFIGSRLCALKMLLHLSKNKDISTKLARADCITTALARIASTMELAANILCVAIITNLTRHPDNASHLVFHAPDLLTILVAGTSDNSDQEICKCSLYALQNLSCTGSIRQELANAPDLLASITKNAFKTQFPEQQLSALHTLKNLSDDPFNLVTMTNTPGCTATLLALANDSKNGMAQFLACDTLATLSHWLLTLSAAKRCKEKSSLVAGIGGANGNNKGGGSDSDSGRRTFQTATWEMWC
eukprot:CAMPEP_0171340094 /NCGR_PEP_ID=MMETSP0878-20121228/8350_1 /TAXON_ID=67004 /ORGANISM="Thalassiosira weissflogii, Strain CCMP1336" /LENGTH=847 /DNA_ID=CAMNT_0011842111 /DNA_START=70 /DNA_END=2613 /DNA_ORIENTATION=+